MRRPLIIGLTTVAVFLATAVPASASPSTEVASAATATHGGWVPWPSQPFDLAAGAVCDFAVHVDPVVDEVRVKTVATFPDGSPQRQLATGALLLRVTNTATGANTIADASGDAVFVFRTDGSQIWYVVGPVLAALRDGNSNLPRGLYVVDGLYTINFSPAPTRFKTFTLIHASTHDVCADVA